MPVKHYINEEEEFKGGYSTAVVSGFVPGLQIPEGGVVTGPGVGWILCRHKRVIIHVLLSVDYQTDTTQGQRTGERGGTAAQTFTDKV